jgi:hypothetical protein
MKSIVKNISVAVAFLAFGQVAGAAQPAAAPRPAAVDERAGGQAQPAAPARPAAPPRAPKVAAPFDITGNWVSIVNEDWRWRMVTPPKGDYASVPLNPEGRKQADTWTEDQDGSCKAYGVGNLMRMPTRVKISWVDDKTLKMETDYGVQTRLLHFDRTDIKAGPRTLQGDSLANWEYPDANGNAPTMVAPAKITFGSLHVVTTNHTDGWLRRNGVPYSEDARINEYIDAWKSSDGADWFVVTTMVDDPRYLLRQFLTSSHFKREPDDSKWKLHPCKG